MSGENVGMDVDSFAGVGSEVLEQALDNASPEQIESILELVENGATDEEIQQSIASGDTGADLNSDEPADLTPSQDADGLPSDPAPEPVVNTDPEPVVAADKTEPAPTSAAQEPAEPVNTDPDIMANDGKNTIPFKVLQDSRSQAAGFKAEADELTRKNALLQQQLEEAEITPKELPENVRITPEKLKELEEYGEIGEVVGVLAQQNAMLMEQLATNRVEPDQEGVHTPEPVVDTSNPLAANADTARWAESNEDWRVVESVNASLDRSPDWQNKSLDERVPEIVRRTKAALGEASAPAPSTGAEIDSAAQAALDKAEPPVPNSLSDAGGEIPGSEKPLIDRLAEGDTSSVEAYLEKQVAAGKNLDDVLNGMLPG